MGRQNKVEQVRRPAKFVTINTKAFGIKASVIMTPTRILLFLGYFFVGIQPLLAQRQKDSITILKEVVLTDAKLVSFSYGIKVKTIADEVVKWSNASLTDLLRYNSLIFFKENGYGMVSSASFRGTSAQQTATVWNGININSQLSGQTDFNTLIPENFDDVTIRSGGGSVQYGSGAIGGSIHLNDELHFKQKAKHLFLVAGGSFNTKKVSFRSHAGGEKWTYGLGVNFMQSENDYKYLGTDLKNENGAFKNVNINADFGYFIAKNQLLKFYHNLFIGNRNFSGTLTAPSNSNYEDMNSRSLIEWNYLNTVSSGKLKLAYLTEEYNYFANKNAETYTSGSSKNRLLNYDYKRYLGSVTLNGIVEYSHITGEGTSIATVQRNLFSNTILMSHDLSDNLKYGLSIRKEFVSDYESPFILAVDARYKLSSNYGTLINVSKNYRVPTFNDLYWVGAGAQGNKNLKPESSKQIDWGQVIYLKNLEIKVNSYYLKVNDLIQWRPNGAVWTPLNVLETEHYGVELVCSFAKSFGRHSLNWDAGAAYTIAKDKATEKQLLYVPKENITSNLGYNFKKWGAFCQFLFNGKAYSTTDNTDFVQAFSVSNAGIHHGLNISKHSTLEIGFKVNNLFNAAYQNVAYRPMPNRNYQIQLITKF